MYIFVLLKVVDSASFQNKAIFRVSCFSQMMGKSRESLNNGSDNNT